MRILLLGDIRPTHLKRWREYFKNVGHEVLTVSLEDDPTDKDFRYLKSSVPVKAFKYYLERGAVRRIIQEFKPDIVNSHFIPTYGILSVAAGFKPTAVSLWGSDVLISPHKSRLHLERALWVLRNCDVITSDSEYMTQEARKLGKFDTQIITQPMGIPKVSYEKMAMLPRRESSSRIALLSTRRLEPIYRVDLLMEALHLVKDQMPPFDCIICGDGSERSRIVELAGEYKLDSVVFSDWKSGDEYSKLLGDADIYVSCSQSDSTSVSLLEAMASGLFPVVTAIPGNAEWVSDGTSALTFPDGDAAELGKALVRAATNRVLRDGAAEQNRRTIEKRAIWENNMAVIEKVFEDLVWRAK